MIFQTTVRTTEGFGTRRAEVTFRQTFKSLNRMPKNYARKLIHLLIGLRLVKRLVAKKSLHIQDYTSFTVPLTVYFFGQVHAVIQNVLTSCYESETRSQKFK